MEHAAQRLNQRPQFRRNPRRQLETIQSWNGNIFRERPRQARDPMLAIELALMRISRSAIGTKRITTLAVTVSSLIAHNPIARLQVFHRPANFCDLTAEFMA